MSPLRPLPLPRDAVRPDYGPDGLFGLVGRVRAFLDGGSFGLSDDGAACEFGAGAPVLVFILIDGLGDAFLRRFGAGSALLAHRRGRITSVFPSTTASAITTIMTGLAPATHGLTGWFINDPRFGGIIAPLPMLRRPDGPVRGLRVPSRLFPYPTLYQGRSRPSILVSPQALAGSPYSRRHGRGAEVVPYRGIAAMVEAIAAAAEALASGGGGLVYAYYPVFDAMSHDHGCASEPVVAQFLKIDAAFARLLERLDGSGVDVLVSADHGFTDSPDEQLIELDRHPDAIDMLACPMFGERRAAFCEVRPGAEAQFEHFVAETLAGRAVVARSADVVGSGMLGPGPRHRRLRERVGSHVLLMEPGWTIADRVPGERRHAMIGVHGGLSADEMWVPRIEVRC